MPIAIKLNRKKKPIKPITVQKKTTMPIIITEKIFLIAPKIVINLLYRKENKCQGLASKHALAYYKNNYLTSLYRTNRAVLISKTHLFRDGPDLIANFIIAKGFY